ncbi:hypothetical protein A2130_02045 [Candidatus Woesebacteria bacterium GWC2_33_12]|uniref:Aspartyl/glutamyl-tRNA(Asn/Gln) amidotransferase subunit B n=1 Tax=Candidatus Woesebacteria bacterium GW2011_GWB1_33_22 TaxID=1618566 RepID=A0A0F9ZLI4_9BACT|nr:MAG: Aspartyl/glutamyl-tRNA(Asn/Gln) amidotransferase subunit B [Candidatus Woesebacteria bacterium GW2011_GWC2_33_12]KKP42283.1 MAG: Aspartyl/glutamyl-tRNA(Asn/Gln) amidotransferase subunit B [Candidatus Woesebacteria bacterium GW2011_GWA2_33_20]KKP45014.1 MAG: Aspartyl/glutamyl-tRNA(Asn/Gln) amidotransferase subunit B [Candidatus Woesebacteria bacterium GW2011_GWB1_33_22]KKP46863.1 MAG: Aspartyl/glutamyl-tRNA(Asn/Gln) amidotransferase subunit B [Microgenomates group bacterium GW2011_GWC1_33
MKYTTIIGLEVHIEPNTKSKMFCGCPQNHFGAKPNSQTCPICLGLPGALPIANKEAINKVIKLGLALGSTISAKSKFYRKHYFYPDLAKSFQTSQKDNPLCVGGSLLGKAINHIHLEEDAGKLIHQNNISLVDFNRCGCALIELVTAPVFHSTSEVLAFTKELQLIARYLDISGADMEKGTMRLEANISLLLLGSEPVTGSEPVMLPDYKVELKNINSFRFLEKAIEAEIKRQELELSQGRKIKQETRGYDENTKLTFSQRSKEDSQDYRYFPEPDIPPIEIQESRIQELESSLPELPQQKREGFEKQYNLSKEYIEILVSDLTRANYFEKACKLNKNYKLIADLMINKKLDEKYLEPAGLVKKIIELTKTDFIPASDVEQGIREVLSENPDVITSYKNGKGQVIGFLIGQVQKKLSGKGDPKLISAKLLEALHG